MRAWIVNPHAYSPTHSAGTRHYYLARELTRLGHAATIITTSYFHLGRRETRLQQDELWKRETIDGVVFHWLRTPAYSSDGLSRLRNMLVFSSRVRAAVGLREQEKPDLIIGSSPHPFAASAAAKLAARYKIPFVLELRDLWPDNLIDMGRWSPRHPMAVVLSRIMKRIYRRADMVLTAMPIIASAFDRVCEFLAHKGVDPKRIRWIPNGVSMEEYHQQVEQGDSEKLELMFLGSHSQYSGLQNLIDAASLLRDEGWTNRLNIRLIGEGSTKRDLVDRAYKLGISFIKFEDPVPHNRVASVLGEADGFIMSYARSSICQWGSSPVKLFNYMAAGKPVIYAMGSEYSPVEHAGAGISVSAGDPQALAGAIKKLYTIPVSERIAMGCRGREYVAKHHDLREIGIRLEQALMEVV